MNNFEFRLLQWKRTHLPRRIELTPNGDPYGRGFIGSESVDGGSSWYFRGDVGATSREWWRRYCKRNKVILTEWRGR